MANIPSKEGKIPFHIPTAGKECHTWYKIVGDLDQADGKHPLIVLHGGPGGCHDYLLPLTDLTAEYSIPVIFYDQVGNGQSTHLQEKNGDEAFWTEDLFVHELDNLIDTLGIRERGFDILGHSWGGMLGSLYATSQPKGLRRLIISNSPASMKLWVEAANALVSELPQDVQDTIRRCEKEGDTASKEYDEAVTVFYKKHLCRVEPWPAPEVEVVLACLQNDSTVYSTMNGPSELTITGSLKTWSIIDKLHQIDVSTLVLNGRYDEAQDSCVVPFFEGISKVKWVTLEKGSHLAHIEDRERYMQLVGQFLS